MGYERAAHVMYLGSVPMFALCSEHQLEALADRSRTVTCDPKTVVIAEGDDAESFYVIMSGEVEVTRDERFLATLTVGQYFGELSLLDPGPRNASITTTSDCVLAALSRDAFRATLDDFPELRDALLTGMARRLHEIDSH